MVAGRASGLAVAQKLSVQELIDGAKRSHSSFD
jgi:hypothetical protein